MIRGSQVTLLRADWGVLGGSGEGPRNTPKMTDFGDFRGFSLKVGLCTGGSKTGVLGGPGGVPRGGKNHPQNAILHEFARKKTRLEQSC